MIKCYTFHFTVFSKTKYGRNTIQTIKNGRTTINNQIVKVPKTFKASPRKEVIDRIIEYAKSGL